MRSHRVLLAAGSNAKGQLGIGSYDDAHTFTPCRFASEPNQHRLGLPDDASETVAQVACGANHTVVLLRHADGRTAVWGAGEGGRGQLWIGYSRGASGEVTVPWTTFRELDVGLGATGTDADGRYACKHVAAAWETTYVVLAHLGGSESDVLLAMGSGAFGALGVEDDGTDRGCGEPRIIDLERVIADSDSDGTQAQARAGDGPKKRICVRGLYAGPRHVVAQLVLTHVGADGSPHSDSSDSGSGARTVLVGWGASRHGQLGPNAGTRFVSRPTRLPIDISTDPVRSCALGNQHTVVLHMSGRLSVLGSNKQGQLPTPGVRGPERVCGLGCTWNGTYMQAIEGEADRCVLLSRGNNAQGQLGRGYAAGFAVEAPVGLPSDRALSRFVCGSEHVLAVMSGPSQEGNSVVGWGWNEHGNMGLGSVGNIAVPMLLWPRKEVEAYNEYPQRVVDIYAGCATSWLFVE